MQEIYLQIPGVKELVEANERLDGIVDLYKEAYEKLNTLNNDNRRLNL